MDNCPSKSKRGGGDVAKNANVPSCDIPSIENALPFGAESELYHRQRFEGNNNNMALPSSCASLA